MLKLHEISRKTGFEISCTVANGDNLHEMLSVFSGTKYPCKNLHEDRRKHALTFMEAVSKEKNQNKYGQIVVC